MEESKGIIFYKRREEESTLVIDKTRIFISSAYEESLKTPRKIIKKHLEECGHEVPIFEEEDFGTWKPDTMKHCIEVVEKSDIVILLINTKSGEEPELRWGNVTPTYLEFQEAWKKKKHILVFVNPDIKKRFFELKKDFDSLYNQYIEENHRPPDSPFDPFESWIASQDGMVKRHLEAADPFVWAFLYDIYIKRYWLYEFDYAQSEKEAKQIAQMISNSLKTVVDFIPRLDELTEIEEQQSYLVEYAEHTLTMLHQRNLILNKEQQDWSNFLKQGIEFLNHSYEIIQAKDTNPVVVNHINSCYAASLYFQDGETLRLVGKAGDITAPEVFALYEEGIHVVDAFNQGERLITYREDKKTFYITEAVDSFVLCLHFLLEEDWDVKRAEAYAQEVECAIMDKHLLYFEFLNLLIGGSTNE
ncbi:DUF4062 domain-containing protein [Bacillus cabrialesii]|uniref:DUF4062 domain-containing protein n=1 Tax=Bacillus cabrialesii TaxID=2487276 RepID=UPI00295F1EA7|nr:DUF4062 domain-containing protein [Bacillus cabrialesii]